jgi:uncharacterized protein with PIN domain
MSDESPTVMLPRTVYLESSALLAWLFDEPQHADEVRDMVNDASLVITSALTLVECHRAIHRATQLERLTPVESFAVQHYLTRLSSSWCILALDDTVLDRASGSFPGLPIRTLDALHVASALEAVTQFGAVELISLDDRVRTCARAAGLAVAPNDLTLPVIP